MDFAMEFIIDSHGNVSFEGYSLFETNNKGAYLANFIGSQKSIYKQLTDKISPELLEKVKIKLSEILKEEFSPYYKGCIGIDMMIYKEKGNYRLHPCLEINLRYNMGYLSAMLYEKYIEPTSHGKFIIDFGAMEGEIYKKHQQMLTSYPPLMREGRITSGYLSLCPVNKESRYRAYILIED